MGPTLPPTKPVQDVPPPGGYPRPSFNKIKGRPGPPGWAIWGAVISASVFGIYRLAETAEEHRQNNHARREARMAIAAYFKHEEDVVLQEKIDKSLAIEAKIMKNRKDWTVGKPLYTKRWSPPAFFLEDE